MSGTEMLLTKNSDQSPKKVQCIQTCQEFNFLCKKKRQLNCLSTKYKFHRSPSPFISLYTFKPYTLHHHDIYPLIEDKGTVIRRFATLPDLAARYSGLLWFTNNSKTYNWFQIQFILRLQVGEWNKHVEGGGWRTGRAPFWTNSFQDTPCDLQTVHF